MSTRRSDAASATLVALVVWLAGRREGLSPRSMLRPVPFFGGAAVAVLVEAVFARWPDRMARFWRRPAIRFGSPVALLAATLSINPRNGTPHAVTLGGLAGYFALLVGITVGVVPEPKQWFRRAGPDAKLDRDDRGHGRD